MFTDGTVQETGGAETRLARSIAKFSHCHLDRAKLSLII